MEFLDRSFAAADMERFRENEVEVDWVKDYALRKGYHQNQLVLGYGSLTPEQLVSGVAQLVKTLA